MACGSSSSIFLFFFYIVWEPHKCALIKFIPSPFPGSPTFLFPFFLPTFMLSSFQPKVDLLLHIFATSRSHQLPITPQLGMGLTPCLLPPHMMGFFFYSGRVCLCSQSHCEHMCESAVQCLDNTFCCSYFRVLFFQSFQPLFHDSPWALEGGACNSCLILFWAFHSLLFFTSSSVVGFCIS